MAANRRRAAAYAAAFDADDGDARRDAENESRQVLAPMMLGLCGLALLAVGAYEVSRSAAAGDSRGALLQPYRESVEHWTASARPEFEAAAFRLDGTAYGTAGLEKVAAESMLSKNERKHDDLPTYDALKFAKAFGARLAASPDSDEEAVLTVHAVDTKTGQAAALEIPRVPLRTFRTTRENAKMCRIHGGTMTRNRGGGCYHPLVLTEVCIVVARDAHSGAWARAEGASCWPNRLHNQYFRGDGAALYRQVSNAAVAAAGRQVTALRSASSDGDAAAAPVPQPADAAQASAVQTTPVGIGAANGTLPAVVVTVRHAADPAFVALNVTSGAGYFGATAKEASVDGWVMIGVGCVLVLPVLVLAVCDHGWGLLRRFRGSPFRFVALDSALDGPGVVGKGGDTPRGGGGGAMVEMFGLRRSAAGERPAV